MRGHVRIRPIDAEREEEIELVAARMRATLEEVLGQERGRSMYSLEWLRDRVRFHLDPARSTGAVLVAVDADDGAIVGHTIVRVQEDAEDASAGGAPFGYFSTTYVAPERRRGGVARALVERGEAWMRERGMRRAATDTSETNARLIELFESRGYAIVVRAGTMVRLARTL